MTGVLIFLAGIGSGVWLTAAIWWLAARQPTRPGMPPASARSIARAARRDRPDLRHVRIDRGWP